MLVANDRSGNDSLNQHAIVLSNPQPRVLCVEDDEDAREMLSALLKFSLIETSTVGTAAQALSLIQAKRFDLYLLDAWLPDLDGFELCRRIRAIDQHTPILFYSGAAYDADKKKGIEAGANAYIIKPEVDGLLASITQFVSQAVSAAVPKFAAMTNNDVCLPNNKHKIAVC